jgi:glucose/arabinose dehydrogenase
MIRFNPSGGGGFTLPLGGSADVQRQIIRQHLSGAPAPTPAPAAETEAASLLGLAEVAAALEIKLGREVLTPGDRAALEADPIARKAWLGKVAQVEALAKARADVAAVTSAGEVEAASARERGRLASTGLLAALEAHRGVTK